MVLVPFDVAFDRIKDDSDRFWSKDRDFLRRTHERFSELLSEVPRCDWNFDTTRMSVVEIVSALAGSIVRDRTEAARHTARAD
jgi:thymidylate kinase